jgi:hypothetical protein
MTKLEELEMAVASLTEEEYRAFRRWSWSVIGNNVISRSRRIRELVSWTSWSEKRSRPRRKESCRSYEAPDYTEVLGALQELAQRGPRTR